MRTVRRPTARAALVPALALALLGTRAGAQEPAAPLWTVQPFGGVLVDAWDVGADGDRTGGLFGLEVGRRLAPHVRAVASIAYARIDDVGGRSPGSGVTPAFRNEWTFASIGPALDVPVGRASVSLSLQAGAAWRRVPIALTAGRLGEVDPWRWSGAYDVSVTSLVMPGAAVHVPVSHRFAIVGGARSYALGYALGLGEGGRLSPAYSLGVSYAP